MTNAKNSQYIIHAKGKEIAVISTQKDEDYISLTDIAKYKNQDSPADVVKNWIRSRDTIEFLGLLEQLSNRILNWSISTSLDRKLVKIHSFFPLRNGSRSQNGFC